jgi:ABC-type methionine transport system permease subunit
MNTAAAESSPTDQDRDRYAEATHDLSNHIGDKIMTMLHTPENQARMQSLLDPVISHIINRVFPYILLSAILFLILFILTIGTFWMVMRTSTGAAAAAVILGT